MHPHQRKFSHLSLPHPLNISVWSFVQIKIWSHLLIEYVNTILVQIFHSLTYTALVVEQKLIKILWTNTDVIIIPTPITSSQYLNYLHTPGNNVLTDSDEDAPSQTSSRYSPETFARIHKWPPYCQISQKSYLPRTYLLFSLHALCSPGRKEKQYVKELLLVTSDN